MYKPITTLLLLSVTFCKNLRWVFCVSVTQKEAKKKNNQAKPKSDSYNSHNSLSLKEIGTIHLSVHVHIDMPLILTVFKPLLSMHMNLGLAD